MTAFRSNESALDHFSDVGTDGLKNWYPGTAAHPCRRVWVLPVNLVGLFQLPVTSSDGQGNCLSGGSLLFQCTLVDRPGPHYIHTVLSHVVITITEHNLF